MPTVLRASLLTSALLIAACRSIPTAEAVLANTGAAAGVEHSKGMDAVTEADARARERLEAAGAEGAGPEASLAAGRALFSAADLRIQAAIVARFGDETPTDAEALIDAEDALPGDLRAEVGGLCREARAAAGAALEALPESAAGPRAEARLVDALGDALGAWAGGAPRALFGGAAGRIPKKLESLAADVPGLEGAAPLRLRGRFLRRAPWPHRDRAAGRALLERAVELTPSPLNLMFMGDAAWVDGDTDLARATWTRAVSADADPFTAEAAPLIRRLVALRLEAAGRGD